MTSLGFVITALAARCVLGEHITAVRWLGVALIVLGAGLVSYSESEKKTATFSKPAPGSVFPRP